MPNPVCLDAGPGTRLSCSGGTYDLCQTWVTWPHWQPAPDRRFPGISSMGFHYHSAQSSISKRDAGVRVFQGPSESEDHGRPRVTGPEAGRPQQHPAPPSHTLWPGRAPPPPLRGPHRLVAICLVIQHRWPLGSVAPRLHGP